MKILQLSQVQAGKFIEFMRRTDIPAEDNISKGNLNFIQKNIK